MFRCQSHIPLTVEVSTALVAEYEPELVERLKPAADVSPRSSQPVFETIRSYVTSLMRYQTLES